MHETIRTNNTKSHYCHVSHYKMIFELYKGCKICKAAPCYLGGNRLLLDISECHQVWWLCPKGAIASREDNCPGELLSPKMCLRGYLCPTILEQWVIFGASIYTNSLNVRSLFMRICNWITPVSCWLLETRVSQGGNIFLYVITSGLELYVIYLNKYHNNTLSLIFSVSFYKGKVA